jgi:hypothetical protein
MGGWMNRILQQEGAVLETQGNPNSVVDIPIPASDVAVDKGAVIIHGTGIANSAAFGNKVLLVLEQQDHNTQGLAIENKQSPSSALYFVVNDAVGGNATSSILFRNGTINQVPSIQFGFPGHLGGIKISPDSDTLSLGVDTTHAIGFYGTNGLPQQTVTGAKGGNAALASLITALANLGLIVDGTT